MSPASTIVHRRRLDLSSRSSKYLGVPRFTDKKPRVIGRCSSSVDLTKALPTVQLRSLTAIGVIPSAPVGPVKFAKAGCSKLQKKPTSDPSLNAWPTTTPKSFTSNAKVLFRPDDPGRWPSVKSPVVSVQTNASLL